MFFFFFFFFKGDSFTFCHHTNASCSDNLLPLHSIFLPFNGNSMCNGLFASKLTENAIILRYNFSLSYCHFSLIFLEGESLLPTVRAQLEP